jgi:hypothetical protein
MSPQSPLLDRLVELAKSEFPDDWERNAKAYKGEEGVRSLLRTYMRNPGYGSKFMANSVARFADVFRDRLVGRRKGQTERERIDPDLVRPEWLRFDPDELLLDGGPHGYADVAVVPEGGQPAPPPPELKLASKETVREAIRAVNAPYLEAGQKTPNVNEIRQPVQDHLRTQGYYASLTFIRGIAGEKDFKADRRKQGERRKKPEPP